MAITARALLRKWFGRGKYPTAEQFAAIFDSFWHKEEDHIALGQIDGLADQLNSKYAATDGQRLEGAVGKVAGDLEQHRTEANEAIDQLREQLAILRSVVENDCVQRTTRVVLHSGSPADLANNE